ncbi:MAG: alpha/beta hydrolase [Actinobacteria bacterium]|nr:alpha/beta hydrolase [Actinomycetota bacterium]
MTRRRALSCVLAAVALMTTACLQPSETGVQYSPAGHASTVADVYPAANNGDLGTIVFVHGGGFQNGSRTDITTYAGPVLAQTLRGWDVVSIDYRFAAHPAAIHDLADAIEFVRSPSGRLLGLSNRRIVVVGHSAGAAIAADLALTANDGAAGPFGALPKVDAWISAAGLLDFTVAGPADAHDAWNSGGDPNASPITHLDAGDPIGLIIHGASDPIAGVGHALLFIQKSRQVGHPTLYRIFDDRGPCSGHMPLCEAARPALDGFLDAIAR